MQWCSGSCPKPLFFSLGSSHTSHGSKIYSGADTASPSFWSRSATWSSKYLLDIFTHGLHTPRVQNRTQYPFLQTAPPLPFPTCVHGINTHPFLRKPRTLLDSSLSLSDHHQAPSTLSGTLCCTEFSYLPSDCCFPKVFNLTTSP